MNRESKLLKYGKNKAGRYGLKQFSLALTASANTGIPLFHKVYPGNVNDTKFFGDYIDELTDKIRETGIEPEGKTLVFDKGNNSDNNIKKVLGLKYNIIGSLKPSEHKELIATPISELTQSMKLNKNTVKYKALKTDLYGREMMVMITFDKKTRKKKEHTFEECLLRLQGKVAGLQEKVNKEMKKERKSKWRKDENIIAKANTFVSKHYANMFDFTVTKAKGHSHIRVMVVPEEYDKFQEKAGKNLLFTNMLDLDPQEVIRLYRAKDFIEKLFKYLKSFKLILLEPQYHRLDKRIMVNTYLKVIAMQMLAYLNKKLHQSKSSTLLFGAVEELRHINRIQYINKETGTMRDLPIQLTEKQEELIKKLGMVQ